MIKRWSNISLSRKQASRWVFGIVILALVFRYFSNALLHQLHDPVLKYPYVDLTYWLYHFLHIPELFTSNFSLALIFDFALLGTAIGSFFSIEKRMYPIAFTLLFSIYFVTYNSFSAHHTHCMIGLLLIGIPFWFKDDERFALLWEGLRYYTLWIFFSAFLWKLFRGTIFLHSQGTANFLNENASYLVHNPNDFWSNIYLYILASPAIASFLHASGPLLQALFGIGFFTKKLDWLWFILPFVFHTLTYIFFHVVFFELLVLNFTFFKINNSINTSNFSLSSNVGVDGNNQTVKS